MYTNLWRNCIHTFKGLERHFYYENIVCEFLNKMVGEYNKFCSQDIHLHPLPSV
jgi:hypothetical protein